MRTARETGSGLILQHSAFERLLNYFLPFDSESTEACHGAKRRRVLSEQSESKDYRSGSSTIMEEGKIARLADRGYGFISREGVEKDLFFHSNELKNVQFNDLQEGDQVTFDVAEGPKGPNAINVNRK